MIAPNSNLGAPVGNGVGTAKTPLAIIPERDIVLYSRCIVCRMNEVGEFEDLENEDYIKSFNEANALIHSNLFRPPHGKIKRSQLKQLKDKNIVAWTVIAYDWDHALSHETVYQNVIKNAYDGAIVAFHDSEKAYNNMISALPRVLEYYHNQGFEFKAL